jgi:hypothetical protein
MDLIERGGLLGELCFTSFLLELAAAVAFAADAAVDVWREEDW